MLAQQYAKVGRLVSITVPTAATAAAATSTGGCTVCCDYWRLCASNRHMVTSQAVWLAFNAVVYGGTGAGAPSW